MIIYVDEANSTNTLLAAKANQLEHGTVLAAHVQTAGRGQRGNSWESEPHKNLTFSVLLKPRHIVASRQFELSQIVSLAIIKVLREALNSDEVYIKWPNDIYYRDSKLCGILIENSLTGHLINQSIAGIGINVNQQVFTSNAPNPISMWQIAGHEFELDPLLEKLVAQIVNDFDEYEENEMPAALAARYRHTMWRGDGYWPYHDMLLDEDFTARIAAVAPTGHLTLQTPDGHFFTFAFKEVASIL